MAERDGAWLGDAKIAGGIDPNLNTHPLSCDVNGVLNVNATITSIFGPIDVIVDNIVPVTQSGNWLVTAKIEDTAGNSLTSTSGSLNVNVTNSSGLDTVNQGNPNTLANAWPVELSDGTNLLGTSSHPVRIDPTGTTTQPVSFATPIPVTQSGTWSIGRTWTLSNLTDSVNIGNFPSSFSVTQGTSPWVVSGTITTSPNVNVHDGSGNSIGSTASSLNVDVTNTVPVTGTFWQTTQPVSESNIDKSYGTWAYYAGTSGTVTISAGQRVTAITCHATTAGSLTINSGATITIPANTSFSDNPQGNITAPTIVFTGTDAYFIEGVS